MGTQLPPRGGGTGPQFSANGCCSQRAGSIKMPLGTQVGVWPRPRPHCVRWESSSPKRVTAAPNFSAHVLWPIGWMDHDATCTEVDLGLGHIMSDGDPVPQKGVGLQPPPEFSVHVCWMDGWIKMPLGTKVGLGPGCILLDGDPAPASLPQKGHTPNFRLMSIVTKRSPIELLLSTIVSCPVLYAYVLFFSFQRHRAAEWLK